MTAPKTYEESLRFDESAHQAELSRRGWVQIERSRSLPDGFDIIQGLPGERIRMTVSRAELAELAAKASHVVATSR